MSAAVAIDDQRGVEDDSVDHRGADDIGATVGPEATLGGAEAAEAANLQGTATGEGEDVDVDREVIGEGVSDAGVQGCIDRDARERAGRHDRGGAAVRP